MSTAQQWVAVDAATGDITADLQGMIVDSIAVTLSNYESTTGTIPFAALREAWGSRLLPYATCVVLLEPDSDGTMQPTWGGIVTGRVRNNQAGLTLNIATIEAYYDRCEIAGLEQFTNVPQDEIVAGLVRKYVGGAGDPYGRALPALPLRVLTTPGDGRARTVQYLPEDLTTVLSAMNDLTSIDDHGIEFTHRWEWADAEHTSLRVAVLIGNQIDSRIGTPVQAGLQPDATFDTPGCLVSATLTEDYSTGRGANYVRCYSPTKSDASGAQAPHSADQIHDDGRITVCGSFTGQNTATMTIDSIAQLNTLAAKAAGVLAHGSNSLTLTQRDGAGPRFGIDWRIGDDVAVDLAGPAFPGGFRDVVRAVGYSRTLGAEPSIDITVAGPTVDAYAQGDGTWHAPAYPTYPGDDGIDLGIPPDPPPDPGSGGDDSGILVYYGPGVALLNSDGVSTMLAGDALMLAGQFVNGNDRTPAAITASSSDPTVAVVDDRGLLKALAPGTALVRISSEGQHYDLHIEVVHALTVQPTTLVIDPTPGSISGITVVDENGQDVTDTASVIGANPVGWDDGVLSFNVGAFGSTTVGFVAPSAGQQRRILHLQQSQLTGPFTLAVQPPDQDGTSPSTAVDLTAGAADHVNLVIDYDDPDAGVDAGSLAQWTTSDPATVRLLRVVEGTGSSAFSVWAVGVAAGTATITATLDNQTASIDITVNDSSGTFL